MVFTILAIAIGLLFAMAVFQPAQKSAEAPAIAPGAEGGSSGFPQVEKPIEEPAVVGGQGSLVMESTGLAQSQVPVQVETNTAPHRLGRLIIEANTGSKPISIGSADTDSNYLLRVDLSGYTPGIRGIFLRDYRTEPTSDTPYIIAKTAETDEYVVHPFSVLSLKINEQNIPLSAAKWQLVETSHGDVQQYAIYQLNILDENNDPVLEIHREFILEPESYDLHIKQRFFNHANTPLTITWHQLAQGDTPAAKSAYMGDIRTLVAGYFDHTRDTLDKTRQWVYITNPKLRRDTVLDEFQEFKAGRGPRPFWPSPELESNVELVWFASLNRYFASVVHPLSVGAEAIPALDASYDDLGMLVIGNKGQQRNIDQRKMVFTLTSKPFTVVPGQHHELNLGLFTGPRDISLFSQQPYKSLELEKTIVYSFGGPCMACTFQWLAHGLLTFLKFLRTWVVFDWGLAIVVMVCCVRLLLHPITKKAQINMMKVGKQMQALQPELEKIKKKYKGDKNKVGQETMKLYKERGVNMFNMLGCLPMLLQMPIWVALYAMLYFAIDLRHEPAFWGVFQAISGGAWPFLNDLSGPDRFIPIFDEPRAFNLLFIQFDYSAINIIPILMGVVFFIQQKFMAAPAATEEQRRQQKMMGYITLIFPFIMFSAPSGLTLYIMSSTAMGIYESYRVRKHLKEQEEAGTLFDKKPVKPGGFVDRMQKVIEAKQQELQQRQGGADGGAAYKMRKSRKHR